MIQSYADEETKVLYLTGTGRQQSSIARVALRRLLALDCASSLEDLLKPPGHSLERLGGDREDQWTIRIDDQCRVCLRWDGKDAWEVGIVDYR